MSQLVDGCTACDKVAALKQPDDDVHPCFKHSKNSCVVKRDDDSRGWSPSECLLCIATANRALSGTGEVRSKAQKNMTYLLSGVTSFSNRVSAFEPSTLLGKVSFDYSTTMNKYPSCSVILAYPVIAIESLTPWFFTYESCLLYRSKSRPERTSRRALEIPKRPLRRRSGMAPS